MVFNESHHFEMLVSSPTAYRFPTSGPILERETIRGGQSHWVHA
jgi:hypothetical protein